ncbi:MAG TPA: SDR family oxidoreductase [Nitrososphaeraceae archaeon]|nr:SDR family oxidoreductase [Nitrososphaeraceae archaeon]
MFARNWAVDLKHRKIRVNAISLGPITTPLLSSVLSELSKEQAEQIKTDLIRAVPLGRMGDPESHKSPSYSLLQMIAVISQVLSCS